MRRNCAMLNRMAMKQTAKVTARGLYKGKPIVVDVIEYDGGEDENGDRKHGKLAFIKNGIKFEGLKYKDNDAILEADPDEAKYETFQHLRKIQRCVIKRNLKLRGHHVYNPLPNTIEAYWLAFNYGDGFDEVPEIEVEGEIDTFGSPFSDEDTSHIYF